MCEKFIIIPDEALIFKISKAEQKYFENFSKDLFKEDQKREKNRRERKALHMRGVKR